MEEPTYSIQDLSDLSGIARRTIHFYTQQGLLPPPVGAGLGARYTEVHVLRLQLIPRLRQQGLRLDEIRQHLQAMDLEALRARLVQIGPAAPAASTFLSTRRTFTHYALPAGMTLIVPAALHEAEREKVAAFIQAAEQFFR